MLMGLLNTGSIFLPVHNQPNQERECASESEMSRLLSAALVDHQFCELLLTRPESALAAGFEGQPFHLSFREKKFVLSVKSTSLADLAEHWIKYNYL
jgi:hypothetical protein